MGYNPNIHDQAQPLEGYQGDKRQQKAHIIIPRKQVGSASNDVGFEKVNGKYVTHASAYDHAWRTGDRLNKLKQTYSEKVVMKSIKGNCKYRLKSKKVTEDGSIKIRVKRM